MITRTTFTRSKKILFSFLLVLAASIQPVAAWNNVGHRTIAELVWMRLDKDERRAVSDLLKQHPHYKQLLTADVPVRAGKDEWAFLTAAVWPDMVRPAKHGPSRKPDSITKYDLYPHAVGFPFLKRGDTNQALLENFFIAKPDAEMVLSNSFLTLKDKNATANERAVSLCWALHLTGDLHQPLHAANRVTKEKPGGEGLGGDFIALDRRKKQINLHSFWDQLPGVDPSYRAVFALAQKLSKTPELNPAALQEYKNHLTIHSWIEESFALAVNFAYAEDRVQFVHGDDLASGKISRREIPALKSDYIVEAEKIAQRRLVLAAARLAHELKQIF